MLSRKQRAQITIYVLKKLYPQCVKRKNLFADKDAEDLVEEIGVHLWIQLIRYRRKPFDQALKLAMTIGVNRLRSIVRTRLTVMKRGSQATMIPYHGTEQRSKSSSKKKNQDTFSLTSKDFQFNGVQVVDTLEAIVSAAIMRVGTKKANALVKALMYDWRVKKTTQPQEALMTELNRNRKGVRKLVAAFTEDIKHRDKSSESATYENLLQKIDGTWKKQL